MWKCTINFPQNRHKYEAAAGISCLNLRWVPQGHISELFYPIMQIDTIEEKKIYKGVFGAHHFEMWK